MRDSDIVRIVSRKLTPFVFLFGLYLVSYGHISPGGGFQGGVVIASGVILLNLGRGKDEAFRAFKPAILRWVEMAAYFAFLCVGVLGILLNKGFLGNFLPLGKAGSFPSAGFVFLLNLVIGIKVGAGISLICFDLIED